MLRASSASDAHHPVVGTSGPSRNDRRDVLLPAFGYALLLLLLVWPYLGQLATHLPRKPNADDAQLIAWILSWVVHAAGDPTATILDANINHPAPAQLTGSDYFLSPQLLFAPLLWLSHNAVLALNVTVLALYWLSGICCERLLRALGCRAPIAFAGGVLFLLGSFAIPFNVHVLQYPTFLLPALALSLTRLRATPDARRAVRVCCVFAIALLSSAYAAALSAVTAAGWAAAELARPLPRRARFVALGLCAAAVAAVPVLPLAHAYAVRAATQNLGPPLANETGAIGLPSPESVLLFARTYPSEIVLQLLLPLSFVGLALRAPVARRIVPAALLCIALGLLLKAGVPPALRDTPVAELFKAVRYPHRFAIVSEFGRVLLGAVGLSVLTEWLRRGLRSAAALVAIVAIVLALPGRRLTEPGGMREVAALGRDREVHRAVGRIAAARGRGPLLVLPGDGAPEEGSTRSQLLQPDSMLGSTLHWLPLIDGYTGHQPPHRLLLARLIHALPERAALADLIDLTHLRWILLRPATAWPPSTPRAPFERALRGSPDIGHVEDIGAWTLLEVAREPGHPAWFATVAGPPRTDTTVLGTPIAPLPLGSDTGTVAPLKPLRRQLPAGQFYPLPVRVQNLGTSTWPVSRAPEVGLVLDIAAGTVPRENTVVLAERWIPVDADATAVIRREVPLRRDVDPGEVLTQTAFLVTPRQPGRYRLELALAQVGGADFSGPGNTGIAEEIEIVAGSPPTSAGSGAQPPS